MKDLITTDAPSHPGADLGISKEGVDIQAGVLARFLTRARKRAG